MEDIPTRCGVEVVATTTTHWDGYPSYRVPSIATLLNQCGDDSDWQTKLNDFFGEDSESGCDYVYIYNITTGEFAILHMDFPKKCENCRVFVYNCVWTGMFDDIVNMYEDNSDEADEMIHNTIEELAKSDSKNFYEYNSESHQMVTVEA